MAYQNGWQYQSYQVKRKSFRPYLACPTCKGQWAYTDRLHLTCSGCNRTFLEIALASNKKMSGQAETQCSQPESEPSAGAAAPAAGAGAPGPPPRQSPSELLGLILSLLGTLDGHDISGDLKEKLTGFKEVAKAAVEANKGPASREQWADI